MPRMQVHIKETVKLAFPVILSNLSYITVGLADTVMIGQYDSVQLAASAFVTNVFVLFMTLVMGLCFGITPLIAAARAKENVKEVRVLFNNSMWSFMGAGALLTTVLLIATPLLGLMGQTTEVEHLAEPFWKVLIASFPFVLFFFICKQFAEGLSDTLHAMIISLAANGLNVMLNYFFIFGEGGFEEMGYMGAAYATLISRVFMAVSFFGILLYKKRFNQYMSFDFRVLQPKKIKQVFNIGWPISAQNLFEMGGFSMAAVMVGWLGTLQLAAHQIALMVSAAAYMVPSGIGSAAAIRIGYYFGLNDRQEVRKAGFAIYLVTASVMLVLAGAVVLLRNLIPTWFTDDPILQVIVVSLLVINAGFMLSDGMMAVGLACLRGLQDVKIPTVAVSVAFWVIGIPLGYLLGIRGNLGVDAFWLGFAVSLTLGAVFMAIRFWIVQTGSKNFALLYQLKGSKKEVIELSSTETEKKKSKLPPGAAVKIS